MKVVLVADGKRFEVDLDLAGGTARVGERSFPVRVLVDGAMKVELEVDGEPVVVEGWPTGFALPPGRVTVNGELHALVVERTERSGTPPSGARVPAPSDAIASPAAPPAGSGEGVAVATPMPGKVVELRVREGERVAAGQVVLVLEAMKMRNEVVAPVAGVVAELHVSAGANVRAREPMLRIRPAG